MGEEKLGRKILNEMNFKLKVDNEVVPDDIHVENVMHTCQPHEVHVVALATVTLVTGTEKPHCRTNELTSSQNQKDTPHHSNGSFVSR